MKVDRGNLCCVLNQKIFLEKGDSKTRTFKLSAEDLKFYNIKMEFVAEAEGFEIVIASSSNFKFNHLFTLE